MLKQSGTTVDKGGFVGSKTSKLLATSSQFCINYKYFFSKKQLNFAIFISNVPSAASTHRNNCIFFSETTKSQSQLGMLCVTFRNH